MDSGLTFERDASYFGQAFQQTLEPRAFYVYVPYRNQDQIPLFDTTLADFNYAQLFNENRFVGGDRFGDTSQITLAVTSRIVGDVYTRGRDELERASDLPRVRDGADAPLEVLDGGHLAREALLVSDVEALDKALERGLQLGDRLVGEILRLPDRAVDRADDRARRAQKMPASESHVQPRCCQAPRLVKRVPEWTKQG